MRHCTVGWRLRWRHCIVLLASVVASLVGGGGGGVIVWQRWRESYRRNRINHRYLSHHHSSQSQHHSSQSHHQLSDHHLRTNAILSCFIREPSRAWRNTFLCVTAMPDSDVWLSLVETCKTGALTKLNRLVPEDLSEWSFRQPPLMMIAIQNAASVEFLRVLLSHKAPLRNTYDGTTVFTELDAVSRSSDTRLESDKAIRKYTRQVMGLLFEPQSSWYQQAAATLKRSVSAPESRNVLSSCMSHGNWELANQIVKDPELQPLIPKSIVAAMIEEAVLAPASTLKGTATPPSLTKNVSSLFDAAQYKEYFDATTAARGKIGTRVCVAA